MKSTTVSMMVIAISLVQEARATSLTLAPTSEEIAFKNKASALSILTPPSVNEEEEDRKLKLGLPKRPDTPVGFRWVDDTLEWRRHKMRISLPSGSKVGYLGAEEGTIENFTLSFDKKVGRRTIVTPFFRQAVPIDDQMMPRGRFNYETQIGFKITIWMR
ncbi:MAG TPA: hypothetical protein VJH55_02460 [Candidatus Paceibacterota bacterium]|uniref:Uncharacterized protein n=1 Tax=Candidatus Zambryskibacteria bacterium RIFCSPHIGHO2_01_FULL_49_18 TaxID=1802740 RepID=A0A1G2T561_9BACT|nr:MAG: hypothetical protein A2758_03255 [Candidatus Zambryskibacteria bacterium RIFCSPHIGHO2_01_FULL_49_18]